MATNAAAITTAEQLWAANIEQRCELIRGELVLMSPAGDDHGVVGGVLAAYLGYYIEENKLGDVLVGEPGFIVERDPDTVLAPDFAFISNERRTQGKRSEKFVPYAPDLVAEVISPSDRRKQVDDKTQQWLAAGCRMVIVVDPVKRSVEQHQADGRCDTQDETGVITGGDVVPGWKLPVSKLFKE